MIEYKKLFNKEECQLIIEQSQLNEDSKPVVYEIDAKRYDGWHFYYSNPKNRWVFDRLFEWLKEITGEEIIKERLIEDKMESPMFVHSYKQGQYFIRHKDKAPNMTFYRKYNFGIQLSDKDDYEGGELVCWDKNNNEFTFPKEIGTALFYDSELDHEVKLIKSGIRWSFVLILDSYYLKKENKLI